MKKMTTILVVDDEPEIRSLLIRFLGKKGFSVVAAGTLSEGRKIIYESNPELVFLDVNLPDGNGLDELKEISLKKLPSKFIMMSAFDHSELRSEALKYGAIDFLSKPFNIARLDEVVQRQVNTLNSLTKNDG
jgi:DNA-binding NtrC family response regulator